jgi:hypothetical protein
MNPTQYSYDLALGDLSAAESRAADGCAVRPPGSITLTLIGLIIAPTFNGSAMAANADDFCAICWIDRKLSRSIAWDGAPICRECLADAISNRAGLPKCPLSSDVPIRSQGCRTATRPSCYRSIPPKS